MRLVFLAIIVLIAVVVTACKDPHKKLTHSHWKALKAAKAAKIDYLRRHLHQHGKIFAHTIHSSPHHYCTFCKPYKRKGLKPGRVVIY